MKNGKYRKAATFSLSGCPLSEEKSFSQRAVKNGIKEADMDITGKVTTEDIEAEQI